MREFTFSEARQQLATLLEYARSEGAVRIRRRDGQAFVLRPEVRQGSPLDVPGINLDLGREDIVALVREARRPA
jgi:hypothetical protein